MDFSKRLASSFLDLTRMKHAAALFGHPERQFRSLHVGGTNGKGSVCWKLSKALQCHGYKVGLYTSPHVSSYRERIQINGVLIDEAWLIHNSAKMPEDLSFFEMMTLLAFLYFAEQKVDIAVIEVGLGGRLDATNIITPELAIITSIAYDHQALLGTTLEAIAREKAGIIKEGVPVIVGPTAAPYIPGIVTALASSYDEENNHIVREALTLMGLPVPDEALRIRPPCRLEEIDGVLLDVAHNPAGLTKLFASLSPKPYQAVIGMCGDKDIVSSLQVISKHVDAAHFVPARGSRAASPEALKALWPSTKPAFTYSTIEEGLVAARAQGPTLATGSFYIMGPIRRALGLIEPFDTEPLQETFKN